MGVSPARYARSMREGSDHDAVGPTISPPARPHARGRACFGVPSARRRPAGRVRRAAFHASVQYRASRAGGFAAALRDIDECVSDGLRKPERDEQLFRIEIILAGLIDNSELSVLLRLKVR